MYNSHKQTSRLTQYHGWAAREHCYTEAKDVRLNCYSEWVSCNGARWHRCLYLQNYSTCPATKLVGTEREAAAVPNNRSPTG